MRQPWTFFINNNFFSINRYRKNELWGKTIRETITYLLKEYLTSKTIHGQKFISSLKMFPSSIAAAKRTPFTQYSLIQKIKRHPEKKIEFDAYGGLCVGLTRYWFLSQWIGTDMITLLNSIDFNQITVEERQVISDIDRLQFAQLYPVFIRTSSSFFYRNVVQYQDNYENLYHERYQMCLIKQNKRLSSSVKKELMRPFTNTLKDKFFRKKLGSPITQACLSAILKDALQNPNSLISITFIYTARADGHVVGLTSSSSLDGKIIFKYFNSNTGERVFDGDNLENAKLILLEELNQVNLNENIEIYISIFKGADKVQLKLLNIILSLYLTHYTAEKIKTQLNQKQDSTQEDFPAHMSTLKK